MRRDILPATGYITVHAYISNAQIPIKDVAVTITDSNGSLVAMRMTDRSGMIDPIPVPVPELSAGQSPNTGVRPYASFNITARKENFERIEAENIQVFPDVITMQNLIMIPLSELPDSWNQEEIFDTPPQNL